MSGHDQPDAPQQSQPPPRFVPCSDAGCLCHAYAPDQLDGFILRHQEYIRGFLKQQSALELRRELEQTLHAERARIRLESEQELARMRTAEREKLRREEEARREKLNQEEARRAELRREEEAERDARRRAEREKELGAHREALDSARRELDDLREAGRETLERERQAREKAESALKTQLQELEARRETERTAEREKERRDAEQLRKAETDRLRQALERQTQEMEILKKCVESKAKARSGCHSGYKGESFECQIEHLLHELFREKYSIANTNAHHAMDLRMVHKEHEFAIGVECKAKKALKALDMRKFGTDLIGMKYEGGIFISSQCGICVNGTTLEKDTCELAGNELYIYSNNPGIIAVAVHIFLKTLCENFRRKGDDQYARLLSKHDDHVKHSISLYKTWCQVKKTHLAMDKQLLNNLTQMGVPASVLRGHLYFVPKSQCRRHNGQDTPY